MEKKKQKQKQKQKSPTGPVLLPVSITNIESGGHGVECHFQQQFSNIVAVKTNIVIMINSPKIIVIFLF